MLVLLMFVGGCAGSTAGALKVSRVAILCKDALTELRRMLRPRSVVQVRFEGKTVQTGTLRAVQGFFFLYMLLLLIGTLIVSLDFTTSFTATLACLSNVGPGLGPVGPMGGFGFFSAGVKVALIFEMLLGRLELFPILLLFFPATWRAK